jgi:BirA family biotin operon repressor/biotin-[acetyl-CoA-carboxylase] ligase
MDALARLPAGYRLRHFVEIDSTNAEAMRLAAAGERGPLWLWADRQLEGRGRRGRSWVSDTGNLYATLLLTLPMPAVAAGSLSVAVSLAVLATCRRFITSPAAPLELKWPNDVLVDGKKVAGILVESTLRAESMVFAIGCGLNLGNAPSGTRYGATALADYGVHVLPRDTLESLAAEVDRVLEEWNAGAGFGELRRQWMQHAYGLGRVITVAVGTATVEGRFEGLSDNGGLVISNHAGLQELHAGEVIRTDISEVHR